MHKLALTGTAMLIACGINGADARAVHRSTTVHTGGGYGVHHSTTVHRTGAYGVHATTRHVAVTGRYHPGAWNRPIVRAGVYHYPHGYSYHRWVVGRPLARAFWAPAYYYHGYAALGLAAPPANYQWIRYGPDLMLVDILTGNVVDIRYGVFG
jgi:Ni/Co efflux regulator RcnB